MEGAQPVWPDGCGNLANRIASFVPAGVKTAFLLMAADGIAAWAVFWTYRRSDVLVVV